MDIFSQGETGHEFCSIIKGSENCKTWFEVNVPKMQNTLELFKEELSHLEKWAKAEEVKLKEQQSKKEK